MSHRLRSGPPEQAFCISLTVGGLRAPFEPEFTLGRREGHENATLRPVDESLCYSSTGLHLAHDYTIDLVDALNRQGLEVEHYYPELAHGQHEVPIRYATALCAADNHVLLRETVRAVAIRRGLWASFTPKPLSPLDEALVSRRWVRGSVASRAEDGLGRLGNDRQGFGDVLQGLALGGDAEERRD